VAVVLAIATHWHSQSLAQSGALISNSDLSKESENPVSRQITLPLRYEGEFQDGAAKATKSTFEIDQAVVPFRLNHDWALITRTKLAAEVLPPKNSGDHWVDGLSNGLSGAGFKQFSPLKTVHLYLQLVDVRRPIPSNRKVAGPSGQGVSGAVMFALYRARNVALRSTGLKDLRAPTAAARMALPARPERSGQPRCAGVV
jgi:hypothetical protein